MWGVSGEDSLNPLLEKSDKKMLVKHDAVRMHLLIAPEFTTRRDAYTPDNSACDVTAHAL